MKGHTCFRGFFYLTSVWFTRRKTWGFYGLVCELRIISTACFAPHMTCARILAQLKLCLSPLPTHNCNWAGKFWTMQTHSVCIRHTSIRCVYVTPAKYKQHATYQPPTAQVKRDSRWMIQSPHQTKNGEKDLSHIDTPHTHTPHAHTNHYWSLVPS